VPVALKQKFDLKNVKDWCDDEGDKAKQAYVDFVRILKKSSERLN
jgi:hypothetical protein